MYYISAKKELIADFGLRGQLVGKLSGGMSGSNNTFHLYIYEHHDVERRCERQQTFERGPVAHLVREARSSLDRRIQVIKDKQQVRGQVDGLVCGFADR